MAEIEFVDPQADPGADEELRSGPRRERSARTTRAVRMGAVAVLVVAGGGLVAARRHQAGSGSVVGSPTPVATSAPNVAGRSQAPAGTAAPPVDVAACPNVDACSIVVAVPAEVSAALRHAFPTVRGIRASTVSVNGPRPTLRSRNLGATAGTLTLAVVIHPATRYDDPVSAAADDGGTRIVYARTLSQGLAITVSVSGAPARVPGLAAVAALAADPRLLAV